MRESRPRAQSRFIEKFSVLVFCSAMLGCAFVLMDPKLTFIDHQWTFILGSAPFSAEIRGSVVSLGLLAMLGSLATLWFGIKNAAARQDDIGNIPPALPPTPAAPAPPAQQGDPNAERTIPNA